MQGSRHCPYHSAVLKVERMCRKPTSALPHTQWAQHPLDTDLLLPLGKGLQGLIFNPFTEQQPFVAEFHSELAAVQETSCTLPLGNRNLSHRDLQDVSPALQENELAIVSKLKLKNLALRTRPLLQAPQAPKCLLGYPSREPSTAFCSGK